MGVPLFLTPRRPAGAFIWMGPEGETNRDTVACVHCRAHWMVDPGSGRERGYCLKCAGPTCGSPDCYECVPYEAMIEQIEAQARMEANLRAIRGGS